MGGFFFVLLSCVGLLEHWWFFFQACLTTTSDSWSPDGLFFECVWYHAASASSQPQDFLFYPLPLHCTFHSSLWEKYFPCVMSVLCTCASCAVMCGTGESDRNSVSEWVGRARCVLVAQWWEGEGWCIFCIGARCKYRSKSRSFWCIYSKEWSCNQNLSLKPLYPDVVCDVQVLNAPLERIQQTALIV